VQDADILSPHLVALGLDFVEARKRGGKMEENKEQRNEKVPQLSD